MKDELDFMNCETLEDVQYMVQQYMIYVGLERPQWKLKKMTPVEYKHHLKGYLIFILSSFYFL